MNLQPYLEGPLLRLRPLVATDKASLFFAISDPAIWDQHPVPRYQPEEFNQFFKTSMATKTCLVVEDRSNDIIIGTSRYAISPQHKNITEIGWTALSRAYWGGLYNREMKYLMVRHLTNLGQRAILNIAPENFRSKKAAEKIGGQKTSADYFPHIADPRPGYATYVLPDQITYP